MSVRGAQILSTELLIVVAGATFSCTDRLMCVTGANIPIAELFIVV